MPMMLQPDDIRLSWYGHISLEHAKNWVLPWRIPHQERVLFPPDVFLEKAAMSAGVRIAFYSDTTFVKGEIVDPHSDSSPIDLCLDGEFSASVPLTGQTTFEFADLPSKRKLIELWLPQFGEFRLHALHVSDGATIEPFEDTRPRWLTYGSSITQCRQAASPTRTWPAIVARQSGLNHTNLGFGGQCHLDSMLARMMRDLPADLISFCVGINIYGNGSLNPRSFRPAIIGFVQILREKHADTPIVVMSPIACPDREQTPNAVGFTLAMMRDEVEAAVQALQTAGDQHIHYIDGLQIFGPKSADLLPDELHPNTEGYALMARNIAAAFADLGANNQCSVSSLVHPKRLQDVAACHRSEYTRRMPDILFS